jgi:uncharacterized protein HemX
MCRCRDVRGSGRLRVHLLQQELLLTLTLILLLVALGLGNGSVHGTLKQQVDLVVHDAEARGDALPLQHSMQGFVLDVQ